MSYKTKNTRKIVLSDFYCTQCGRKGIPVFRPIGQEREPGHLKKLFCLYCQKETNMVEIRSKGKYHLENFWLEYKNGNFDNDGNRKEPWKQFCAERRNKI